MQEQASSNFYFLLIVVRPTALLANYSVCISTPCGINSQFQVDSLLLFVPRGRLELRIIFAVKGRCPDQLDERGINACGAFVEILASVIRIVSVVYPTGVAVILISTPNF